MNNTPDYIADTIVAAATPAGSGGVAITRVSGPDAERICRALTGSLPAPRVATNATFRDQAGHNLDYGLALYFPAPNSFTGEAVVELHGHGGPTVTEGLINAAIELGARRAMAGEFSKRAYLNSKIDLVQAEAIADLISSGTQQAARAALRSLAGEFSKAVAALQLRLTNLRMHTEAALDFPEEEIDFLSDSALLNKVTECRDAFASLLRDATLGRVLRDGIQLVIVGRPNAGKSSLLNLLSGQDAAIVTEVAGTTRDILRESIDIDGLAVELVDTAGLRDDPDRIEAEGIRRARDAVRKADAILHIRDATVAEQETIIELEPELSADVPVIVIKNKIDLLGELAETQDDVVHLSAQTGAGLTELRAEICKLAGYRDQGEGAFTARRLHLNAIKQARTHFELGSVALREQQAGEIFAEELRMAQHCLGEVTGEFSSDDLLGKIFAEFCIGK